MVEFYNSVQGVCDDSDDNGHPKHAWEPVVTQLCAFVADKKTSTNMVYTYTPRA